MFSLNDRQCVVLLLWNNNISWTFLNAHLSRFACMRGDIVIGLLFCSLLGNSYDFRTEPTTCITYLCRQTSYNTENVKFWQHAVVMLILTMTRLSNLYLLYTSFPIFRTLRPPASYFQLLEASRPTCLQLLEKRFGIHDNVLGGRESWVSNSAQFLRISIRCGKILFVSQLPGNDRPSFNKKQSTATETQWTNLIFEQLQWKTSFCITLKKKLEISCLEITIINILYNWLFLWYVLLW